MLEKICEIGIQEKYKIVVIAGALNTDVGKLQQFVKQWENITVYVNVAKLAAIMKQVDLVVSAASTVLYECCCMQKPTIFFTMADNQEEDVAVFSDKGMMCYAGDIRKNKSVVVENIAAQIENIAQDLKIRASMMEKMGQVIDGKGAERIARRIVDEG